MPGDFEPQEEDKAQKQPGKDVRQEGPQPGTPLRLDVNIHPLIFQKGHKPNVIVRRVGGKKVRRPWRVRRGIDGWSILEDPGDAVSLHRDAGDFPLGQLFFEGAIGELYGS
jgi:hypothetical protein